MMSSKLREMSDKSREMNRQFAGDMIEAAKSARAFDAQNTKEISEYYNMPLSVVREELVFVRKNLSEIDPEWFNNLKGE